MSNIQHKISWQKYTEMWPIFKRKDNLTRTLEWSDEAFKTAIVTIIINYNLYNKYISNGYR